MKVMSLKHINADIIEHVANREINILKQLSFTSEEIIPVITIIESIKKKDSISIVMEQMDYNMRDVLKMSQRFDTSWVLYYSWCILNSLDFLDKHDVIHADLKLDNVLIRRTDNAVKLADFGSSFVGKSLMLPSPEISSRYYRSPEIILGEYVTNKSDMFSFGCCLYEMITGEFLFQSKTNNHHLYMQMEIFGDISCYFTKGQFYKDHFNKEETFVRTYKDKSNVIRKKKLKQPKKRRDILEDILSKSNLQYHIEDLTQIILHCIQPNPTERPSPTQTKNHKIYQTAVQTIN
eukprot:TRINITY_DN617_c0_g1_i7.p1 TRINITY_DN617_c0_g1~~TRINITY_DN617_c0_g1_i7.p1  ORF type:complete len:292 (+),score=46.68 TRINITY_DN617_c0_g1_i7:428-1303(+)